MYYKRHLKRIYLSLNQIALFVALMAGVIAAPHANGKEIKRGDTITTFNGAQLYVKGEYSSDMKIIAQAILFNWECSMGDALRLTGGLQADYFLPKFASVRAQYLGSYFNLQKMEASDLNLGQNTVKGFSSLELGGRLHLIDHKGTARHKLILSSNTEYVIGGTVTHTRYVKARMPCRRILAVRGGLYRTTAPVSTDMNARELEVGSSGGVKTKSGTVLSNSYFTNAATTGVYVGLADIINMSVRTGNNISGSSDDTYFTSLFRELFVDVLLAKTSFDPFQSGGIAYDIAPNTPGSFQTNTLGWRVGKKMIFTRRTINMGFSFELGNRPGIQGRGIYFSSGMSLAFVK